MLTRRTPLKRKAALRSRKRIKPRNTKRLARLREAQFGPQAELCRRLPCCACVMALGSMETFERSVALCIDDRSMELGPSEPHHEPPRSCGGVDRDCAPLCATCHRYRHDWGEVRFCAHYRIDLRAIAARIHQHLQESKTP